IHQTVGCDRRIAGISCSTAGSRSSRPSITLLTVLPDVRPEACCHARSRWSGPATRSLSEQLLYRADRQRSIYPVLEHHEVGASDNVTLLVGCERQATSRQDL